MVSGKKIGKLVHKYIRVDQPVQGDDVGKCTTAPARSNIMRGGCSWRSVATAPRSSSRDQRGVKYSDCPTTGCARWDDDVVPADVPEGCLAVYVGPEMRRFVIQTELLYKRAFRELLQKSEEEYGFESAGGLRIACEAAPFETLLWHLQNEANTYL